MDTNEHESERRTRDWILPIAILKGLWNPAQGCESASYPGFAVKTGINPERVVANGRVDMDPTPLGLKQFPPFSQGSSRTRNPGLKDGIPLGFKRE
jgi:hypothetical protein